MVTVENASNVVFDRLSNGLDINMMVCIQGVQCFYVAWVVMWNHVEPCETSKCKLTTSQMAFETAIAGVAVLQGVAWSITSIPTDSLVKCLLRCGYCELSGMFFFGSRSVNSHQFTAFGLGKDMHMPLLHGSWNVHEKNVPIKGEVHVKVWQDWVCLKLWYPVCLTI